MIARKHIVPASIIASFGVMIVALPVVHWLHLQPWLVCPFRALTGIPCPTCGYARTFHLVQQGRLADAVRFQPFVMIVVILSGIAAGLAAKALWRDREVNLPGALVGGLWVTLGVSWIWNLAWRL